ncbi:Rieske (2Fe-2S) protein [Seongchinamella sediminis]|uniref:Rieske (2Fe-2S) protein n=1 Tax=Seongchinamella sediminis TaxID=2283635 RepID=A0A3L7DX64_9GAMM|nr:Rieske (2Fe-2S) protein [Seongchinamella sediminis]RLQ20392.1 Rieske (2Fe-2S) protein [Seongchinamella sediminis]
MRFYPLEKLINLHDNYSRQFKIDHLQLLLLQRDGQLYLIEANCPHRAHPLDSASIAGNTIECPLHQYRFNLADGRLLQHTEEPCRALKVWDIAYEGVEVGVMLGREFDR